MSAPPLEPLNPIDRAMLTVDRSLRSFGYPGFQTQMLIRFTDRVDVDLLRKGTLRFARRHPLAAARLVESPFPHWRYEPDPLMEVHETELASGDDTTLLARAARLLSTPFDPSNSDPVRLEIVHRPERQDVLLMQYSHILLDNNAAPRVVQELNELSQSRPPAVPAEEPRGNLIWRYLRRFPASRRRAAVEAAIRHWRQHVQHGAATVGRMSGIPGGPMCFRLASATLDEQQTRALRARATDACGLPAVSMTILASVFRTIARLASTRGNQPDLRRLVAGIGMDLNLRGAGGPLFGNLMSLLPIHADFSETGERNELARILNSRLRTELAQGIDLGVLQQTTVMSRRPRLLQWAIQHFLRHTCSLWYAHFGAIDQVGSRFCGAPIERIAYFGPAWPPLGLTLLASTYRDQLTFGMTSVPSSVPDEAAAAFLDAVLEDLL